MELGVRAHTYLPPWYSWSKMLSGKSGVTLYRKPTSSLCKSESLCTMLDSLDYSGLSPFISSPVLYVSRHQYFTILVPFSYVAFSHRADRGYTYNIKNVVYCYHALHCIVRCARLLWRFVHVLSICTLYTFAC